MKNIYSLLLVMLTLSSHSLWAQTQGLPVIHLTYQGDVTIVDDYLNATMQLTDTDGSQVNLPALIRMRGATARQYSMKPALNLKLRTDDYTQSLDSSLLGMRSCSSWILDAMAIDRICMRNRVIFDIWNEMAPLPYQTQFDSRNGTVGRFIELYMNGTYYGIYCLSDKINRKLLDLKKPKENTDGSMQIRGVLYKNGTSDIHNQEERGFNDDYSACTVEWHSAWELTEPDDYSCPEAWTPLLDAYDNGQSFAYVKRYFYLQNLADYQLLIMAMSIGDNWGNKNRFLSIRNMTKDIDSAIPEDADSRRFVITPWDLDTGLGGCYNGDFYGGNYSNWPPASIVNNGVYPFHHCIGQREYETLLRQTWLRARQGALSVANVSAHLYQYRDLFMASGAWQRMTDAFDRRKYQPCYVHDLPAEIDAIIAWYTARFAEMDAYFQVREGETSLLDPESEPLPIKIFRNGQMQILRNGHYYSVTGALIQ